MQLQLAQGVVHVVLHRAVGEHEPFGDLLVGQPLGDQSQHLGLARGQARAGLLLEPAVLPEHQPGQPRGEDGITVAHPVHGVDQLLP